VTYEHLNSAVFHKHINVECNKSHSVHHNI